MDNKELIRLLGLSKWYEKEKKTTELASDKPLKYLDLKPDAFWLKDINLISAPLGMGKTHMFLEKLEGTTCLITPRKSITRAFADNSKIDFIYYLTEEGRPRKEEELREANNLAIVNLSIRKLISDKELKAYDNLIIDELELVLSSSVDRNSSTPQDTEDAFRSLIQHSKKVYGLGWLFRNYTINYLESFNRPIYFERYHRDIATDIELNVYKTKEQFYENLNEVAKSQRVLLFTDRTKDTKKIAEKINATTETYWASDDHQIPKEKEQAYADTEKQGMTAQVEIFSPIVSHGYNFRNETPRTAMLLLNTTEGSRMTMTDLVQFMFRNRDQKVIDLFMYEPEDTKELEELEQIATTPAQFTSSKIRTFGTFNPALRKKVINQDDEIVKRKRSIDNIARIEKAVPRRALFLYLRWLGLTNINLIKERDCAKQIGISTSPQKTIDYGKFLQPVEYAEGTIDEQAYTDICNDFGVEEITLEDISRWDNGNFKANAIRQKQMYESKTVRNSVDANKGLFGANEQFGKTQYRMGKFIKDKDVITNAEFKVSEYWQNLLKYEYLHNKTMLDEHLPELCIKPDDKVKPLLYLKRFLEKHNFHCVIEKPNKDDKPRIRKEAEKSCRPQFQAWKLEQQPIIQLVKKLKNEKLTYWDKHITRNKLKELEKEIKWCGKENISIVHYLDFLIAEGRHKELTKEMKALRLIADTWVMTIKEYED